MGKLEYFIVCLNRNYCDIDVFIENTGKSIRDIKNDILKMKSDIDIDNYVNNYI